MIYLPAKSRANWFRSNCCVLLTWFDIELFPILLLILVENCWDKDFVSFDDNNGWKRWFEIKGDFSWLFCDWFLKDNI